MKLSIAFLFLQWASPSFAFAPQSSMGSSKNRQLVPLNMAEGKKLLTAAEILARTRAAVGADEEEEEEEPPQIFDDGILEDMRASLLALEKRVKEGPGSLSLGEVQQLDTCSSRIITEMNEYIAENGDGPPRPEIIIVREDEIKPPADKQNVVPPQAKDKVKAHEPTKFEQVVATSAPVKRNRATTTSDDDEDEGPTYEHGKNGFGLARGTANTYVIPGMDEMTPEEYRKELQRTVSERQTRRHEQRGGVVGNRAAHQYLDHLGAGGASTNWKKNEDEEETGEN